MLPSVVAIIPARGQSKRLPRKNLYPLLGRPLLEWTIEAVKASHEITHCYVSTEDAEIKRVALELGIPVIDRPPALAADTVWTQDVLQHAVKWLEEHALPCDIVVRIQANSPQVEAEKIDEAIIKLREHNLWEVFSVNREGLEDAAIHVLRKKCVYQQALSVYKGIVQTNYIDVHTPEDIRYLEEHFREELLAKASGDRLSHTRQTFFHN